MVVHGQIILNQFKNFPKKSVANSAFVSGLKGKMELRRHCKLYAVPRPKARVRVRVFACPRIPSHAYESFPEPRLLCFTSFWSSCIAGAITALVLSAAPLRKPTCV